MASANHVEQARRDGVILGVPLGDLGWFQSLLMSTAAGFASFFLATFLAIIGMLVYSTASHHMMDFALAYRRVGFPVGVTVWAVALLYLGVLWVRRMIRKRNRA